MKILFFNNYFYERGGAEKSLFDTARLLEHKGHEVFFLSTRYKENNPYIYDDYFIQFVDYNNCSFAEKLKFLPKLYWNYEAHTKIRLFLEKVGMVDLIHLNNIMYRIGPSIIKILKKKNIPIVFHLRDYNLMCGAVNLMCGNEICEACKNFKFFNAFIKRCKGFTGGIIITTTMFFYHKIMRFFDDVDVFISPSHFLRKKYIELGFNREIEVLPNFLKPEKFEPSYNSVDGSYVYFGRLSLEKGLFTLLKTAKKLPHISFKIIGAGPLYEECKKFINENKMKNVTMIGYLKGEKLYDEIKKAKASVVPSEWYENNSKVILESMALGKPVIASNIGGNPELVIENETGYLFEPFNEESLTEKILMMEQQNRFKEMGKRAREIIERQYNDEIYYERLMKIYQRVLKL